MCELFAMSSRRPVDVTFSLEEFSRHGGLSGPHKDGWGIAYFEGRGARLIREPRPATSSAWVRFIKTHPLRSTRVISHIRRATQGKISLENTQPFARELGGRLHVFAHNGDVGLASTTGFASGRFRPLGETDSERAFCELLARLEPHWLRDGKPPSHETRSEVVVEFARELRGHGIANFIYSDGELLFAHGDKRHQTDGSIRPPGLHFLCRSCVQEPSDGLSADGLTVTTEGGEQDVVLIASVPLTDEGWEPLAPGEVLTAAEGKVLSRTPSTEAS